MRVLLPLLASVATAAAVVGCSSEESNNGQSSTDAEVENNSNNNSTNTNNNNEVDDAGVDAGVDLGVDDMDSGMFDAMPDLGFPDMGFADTGVDVGFPSDAGVFDTTCDPTFFDNGGGACGGVLTGRQWRFAEVCGDSPALDDILGFICPPGQATEQAAVRTVTGRVSFGVDQSYLFEVVDTIMTDVVLANTCVELYETCSNVASAINDLDPELPVSCETVGGTCTCSITSTLPVEHPEPNNFNVDGTTVTLEPSGGILERWDYCVANDDVLRVRRVEVRGSEQNPQLTELGTYVLTP